MKKIFSLLLLALTANLSAGNDTAKTEKPETLSKDFAVNQENNAESFMSDESVAYRHVVKLNITPLAIGNIPLQYEFSFHKNLSAALGINVFNLPKRIRNQIISEDDGSGEGLTNFKIGGWSITPEFRFYPGKKEKHQAPHGFYLAPYFRYSKTNISGDFVSNLPDPNNSNVERPVTTNMALGLGGYSMGLMIGSQWLIGKHFVIDWWILGAGSGKGRLTAELSQDAFVFSSSEQDELRETLENSFENIALPGYGSITPEVTTNETGAKLTLRGVPMTSVRAFGLSLGIYF